MAELTESQKLALEQARYLAENGAPIFLARPNKSELGYRLPDGWQHTEPDPSVVDLWKPGYALCLVTGVLVDAVDIDPRNGGDAASLDGLMPTTYGRQTTPSGGTHDLIAPLGVPKGKPFPGIDVQAGDADGTGRGFVFIAPTERASKTDGVIRPYEWEEEPDVDVLALIGDDGTGKALAEAMEARQQPAYDGPSYDGPSYDDLTDAQRQQADEHVRDNADRWRARFAEAQDWPDGATDDAGRGWEALTRDWAWACARMATTPWLGLDDTAGQDLFHEVLPDVIAANGRCSGKWDADLLSRAASKPVEPPPWQTPFDAVPYHDDVDVADESVALRWLKAEVGRGRLSGILRRGHELVHTPRICEAGYIAPKDDRDNSGPAQVRRIDALEIAGRIDHGYRIVRVGKKDTANALFPQAIAARAAATPDLLPNVSDLRGVTHTPVIRRDGTVLDTPGYDPASGMLYLPDPSLTVPKVSDRPTRLEVQKAGKLLLDMVADFPFVTPHDRANYLGALLTPLLRPLVPPPYKLVAIGAPQRGSGKSLLAWIVREVHGGVLKSDFPTNDDELRKYVTATLDTTTGPAVQFDNVTGVLKSAVLDGLLTTDEWSDRRLGVGTSVTLPNDRLWLVTGNNLHIGGDLERRTLWVTINANEERPEERTNFAIPHLETWVREHRGDLLWALLTLVRAWVAVGQPTPERPESTNFGSWIAALRGILKIAKLGDAVGVVGHAESAQGKADPEEEEWAAFLAAVFRVLGSEPWTASDLLEKVNSFDGLEDEALESWLLVSELPGDLALKFSHSYTTNAVVAKSLGKWLGFRDGRWAGGLSIQNAGNRRGSKLWRAVDKSTLG